MGLAAASSQESYRITQMWTIMDEVKRARRRTAAMRGFRRGSEA
jgi:hypothetical protein